MNKDKLRVAFHTLGCKLNFAETSTIARSFQENKFEKVTANQPADIYIINTCSVTDAADRKCRQAIKKFINLSPNAFIAVVGCYAQLKPQEISSIPGVDLVLGINEKFDIQDYISVIEKKNKAEIHSCDLSTDTKFHPSYSVGDRTRSFLKVQDGCDYGCSYCTIPLARGNSRNPEIELIVAEAKDIAARGVKEIVLTGVNIGDFGKTTGDTFFRLLTELNEIDDIARIRISSIEPNLLSDDIINLAASGSKVQPHFHIPLQSGSDKILGLMRRRYRREVFSDRVAKIKELMPLAGIGADVIVGFPGETDEDFEETYKYLENLPLTYLHVFSFSERPGTIAETLPGKVVHTKKEERSKSLSSLSEKINMEFLKMNIGQTTGILFEHSRYEGLATGFTGNYIKVYCNWKSGLAGTLRNAQLTGISPTGKMNIDLIN